jgi:ABC-type transport system involved in multi-copper enzyme maturation permease subunit
MLFSVIAKKTSTSMLASIGTWMFFSIVLGMLANVIAGALVPLPTGDFKGGREALIKGKEEWDTAYTNRWEVQRSIIQISPTTQYEETATAILGASTDFDLKTQKFQRTIPLAEALVANWASIAFLAVGLVVCFVASYMLFLRMEIRPGD